METWQEALDMLRQCQDELENAVHMGDAKRMRDCRKWVDEAVHAERKAYKEALDAMKDV